MTRKHWEPDHPSVMAWAEARHKRSQRAVEVSVALRRREAGERCRQARQARKRGRDWQKWQGIGGLVMIVAGFFTYHRSETAGENVWAFSGFFLALGVGMIVHAVAHSDEGHR